MNQWMRHKSNRESFKCVRCTEYKYNAPMYLWKGVVSKLDLGHVCQKCAISEAFGSNHRNNKKYQEWRLKNVKT